MPIGFMLYHFICFYANFRMGYLETLEFSPQVQSQANAQQAIPKSALSNPRPQKSPMDTFFAPK